jgi:O-antigen/teichoic acid export membrane protein
MGIANVVMTFLDASVFSFLYPSLIKSVADKNKATYDLLLKRLCLQVLGVTAAICLLIFIAAPFLMDWIDKPIYSQHYHLLYWTVLAEALSGLSMIPHYALYACRNDKPIVWSHLASLPIFVCAAYYLNTDLKEAAIPAAMAIAFFCLLIMKSYFYRRSLPNFSI